MVTARARLLVVLLAGTLALAACLTGCSSGDKGGGDPTKALAAAKRQLDATSGVHLGLTTPQLPHGVSGLLDADGVSTHAPAFAGTIKVSASGITADADVVAVHDVVYAKLPFTTKFAKIDPADYSAPDPAKLLSARGGLSSLLTAATGVKQGKQVRDGKQVLTSYDGTVPGRAVAAVIPSARASARFHAVFTLTAQHRLTRAVLRGPFYPRAGDVTYTITFRDYGTHKSITAP